MINNLKEILESDLGEIIISPVSHSGKIQTASGKQYFLKSGSKSRTFLCEANGLKELGRAGVIRIAKVISVGENYILTEYIEQDNNSGEFFEQLGKQLALLHKYQGTYYGFYEDNYIGLNPQLNIPTHKESSDWITFYFNKRLLYQFRLAEKNGYISAVLLKNFIRLENKLYEIIGGSIEQPTLLHGDLWAGNFLCDTNNSPVLIDPAVYYGHREADLAMTKIFGGFPSSFYESYQNEYPLKDGWQYRENIYKLYHILNHLNLFGYSYLPEVEYIVNRYL